MGAATRFMISALAPCDPLQPLLARGHELALPGPFDTLGWVEVFCRAPFT